VNFLFIYFPDAFGFIHNAVDGIVNGKDFDPAQGPEKTDYFMAYSNRAPAH
jgi:hypothetical protein